MAWKWLEMGRLRWPRLVPLALGRPAGGFRQLPLLWGVIQMAEGALLGRLSLSDGAFLKVF